MIIFIGTFVIGLAACVIVGISFGLVTVAENFWSGFVYSLAVPFLVGIYYIGKALVVELNLI